MALHTPNQYYTAPTDCHVCGKQVEQSEYGIEHSGMDNTIWLHPECATILVLRLSHDVVRVGRTNKYPLRVQEVLRDSRKDR